MKKRGTAVAALAAWWLWIPFLVGVLYVITHYLMGGMGVQKESWNLFFQNNIFNAGVLLWIYLVIGFLGSLIIYPLAVEGDNNDTMKAADAIPLVLIGILLVCSFVQFFRLTWDNDKDGARYYNTATTFYAPSLKNPPTSLQYLLAHRVPDGTGCVTDAISDVPNKVCVGTLSQAGFAARTSSADGALLAMQRTSGSTQNVDLLDDTLIYLQGKNAWSAIRDGSGNNAHTEGVVEWTGDGTPSECYFSGKDELDKAIQGAHTNSLSNLLANEYPNLYWTSSDVYGYCDNGHPTLVFLMREQVRYLSRTLDAPAGAVIVNGSPSGAPVFKYEPNPTDLPGPSYPQTIADDQLNENVWAAGRSNDDHGLFGYETDASGDGDYLLKSNANGFTYWVTPLTLNSSQSQLYVAYAVVRADTVRAGHLNPLSIYVLASNDVRRINIDSLEASAKDYLSTQVPGFFSSGGSLNDYTPLTGDVWRAFAEINGRVVYRLDISASNAIAPDLVSLDTFATTGAGAKNANTNAICGTAVANLTQAQIVLCAQTFVGHLNDNG